MKTPEQMAASKPKIDWGGICTSMDASSDFLQSILLQGNCGELEFAAVASILKFILNTQ